MKKLIFILLLIPFLGKAFDTDTIHGNWVYKDSLKTMLTIKPTAVAGIDSNNTIGRCACQCIQHVRDSVSSYQILHSYTAPDTLIAAPGAGYFIKIIGISAYYHYVTSDYSFSAGGSGFALGDFSNYLVSITQLLSTFGSDAYVPTLSFSNFQNISPLNKPLTYFTQTANPTTGHGYMIITVDYIIEQY